MSPEYKYDFTLKRVLSFTPQSHDRAWIYFKWAEVKIEDDQGHVLVIDEMNGSIPSVGDLANLEPGTVVHLESFHPIYRQNLRTDLKNQIELGKASGEEIGIKQKSVRVKRRPKRIKIPEEQLPLFLLS